jgi:hypothetical protein
LALAGISIEAPVRDRIPSMMSDKEEFTASIVRSLPSQAMTGACSGFCTGGSHICEGGGAGVSAGGAEFV